MIESTAVITAGGYGTRCDSRMPKSLLPIGQRTYLEMLLNQLARAGVRDAIIYCDRAKYLRKLRDLPAFDMRIRVLNDGGVASTFELAKHSVNVCDSSDILFCYGHSPRPHEYLESVLQEPGRVVASIVKKTSKRLAIGNSTEGFIEPPYRIPLPFLRQSTAQDWNSFFKEQSRDLVGLFVNGPCEFNTVGDHKVFAKYIAAWDSISKRQP